MASNVSGPAVYVACGVPGLAATLKELAPNIEVVNIQLESAKNLSEVDRNTINTEAEVLLSDSHILVDVFYTGQKLKWSQIISAGVNVLIKVIDCSKCGAGRTVPLVSEVIGPTVYVASEIVGLAATVKELAPSIDVVDIQLDESDNLSEEDKNTINTKAEVLLTDPHLLADLIYTAKKLKWSHSSAAGVNELITGIDYSKPIPNIQVTRTGKGFGGFMAEFVLGQIIAREKRFLDMYEEQKLRTYNQKKYQSFRPLSSLRIGILGSGQIGTEIGNILKQIGMEVWGLSRQIKPQLASFDTQKTPDQLKEFLKNCDYICSVLPSTPATKGLLAGDVLENCKEKKSVLINVGRGDVIDEESIAKAIKNEWISGAILDVFEKEPLPKDSILWTLPNVVISPHVSGPNGARQVAEAFLENYQNYIEGKPLNYKVDFDRGY